jgi:hypothetical protein
MTLLLFLISLIVMKRILSRLSARQGISHRSVDQSEIPTVARIAEPLHTLGLTALGQAISRHGRGRSPTGLPTAEPIPPVADPALPAGKTPIGP